MRYLSCYLNRWDFLRNRKLGETLAFRLMVSPSEELTFLVAEPGHFARRTSLTPLSRHQAVPALRTNQSSSFFPSLLTSRNCPVHLGEERRRMDKIEEFDSPSTLLLMLLRLQPSLICNSQILTKHR